MDELTGLDARFLYSETPTAHMHTMKVVVMNVAARTELLTPDVLSVALADRLDRMPILRRRAVPVPGGVSHPTWVDASDFDLNQHIAWRTAEPPGDRAALAAVVAEVAATPLPRNRPLWEITVVDGLDHNRIAFVVKLHHAVADGVAAAAMLENAFMADEDQAVTVAFRPEPIPPSGTLLRQAMGRRLRRFARLPHTMAESASGALSARRALKEIGGKAPGMFSGPRSILNVSLSDRRTFAVTDLPMADLLDIRSRHGVSVNDVFLTICGGALRSYLENAGNLPARTLTAGVPISTHTGVARLSGNHIDNMVVALRTDLADPLERLAAIHQGSRTAKRLREAMGTDLFERRAGHTPPRLYPLALRMWAATKLSNRLRPPLNLVASNVAGPRHELTLDGGTVAELWSVGPILEGIGLNMTAWSYRDTLYVSVLGCPESLPRPEAMTTRVQEAFAELRDASLRSRPTTTA